MDYKNKKFSMNGNSEDFMKSSNDSTNSLNIVEKDLLLKDGDCLNPNINESINLMSDMISKNSIKINPYSLKNNFKLHSVTESINLMSDMISKNSIKINPYSLKNNFKLNSVTESINLMSDMISKNSIKINPYSLKNNFKLHSVTESINLMSDMISKNSIKINPYSLKNNFKLHSVTESINLVSDIISKNNVKINPYSFNLNSITESVNLGSKAISEKISELVPNLTRLNNINNNYIAIKDIVNSIDFNNIRVDISKDYLTNETLIKEAAVFVEETIDTIEYKNRDYNENWQHKIKEKFDAFQKANPIYAYLILIILPILIQHFVIDPMLSNVESGVKKIFSESSSYNNRKKDVRKMFELSCSIFGDQFINRFRYINKDNIYLKINHYRNSQTVVKLNEGSIVKLEYGKKNYNKKRYKNWLYVEYEAHNGIIYRGWINNIYTSKVK